MKYNEGNLKAPEKTARNSIIFLILSFLFISILVFGVIGVFVYFGKATFNMEAIIALIALIISLTMILFSFIDRKYQQIFSTKKTIDIRVDVVNNLAICWGAISNSGKRRILNKNVYLVISKGIKKENIFEFNLPLEHETDSGEITHLENYCIYSKLMHLCSFEKCISWDGCKDTFELNNIEDPRTKLIMNRYNNLMKNEAFHRVLVFRGLSKASRLFVDPGEEFNDELVLELESGVYRALMIWIPEGNEDCACSVKYFKI